MSRPGRSVRRSPIGWASPRAPADSGWGDGTVALALTFIIFCLVAFLAITRRDVQSVQPEPTFATNS